MAQVGFQGNVGKVQGLKFAQDGSPRFQFSVAEGHRGKVNGEWADTGTTWWGVTVFGKPAEDLAEVIVQGRKQRVVVVGRSSTREYEVDGVKRTSLDVVADHVGVVSSRNASPASTGDAWGAPQGVPGPSDQWGTPNVSEPPF